MRSLVSAHALSLQVRTKLPSETWQALEEIALGILDAENEIGGEKSSDAEDAYSTSDQEGLSAG